MANYTPTFTKPYPSGWVDKPSKTTPVTAAIMNSYDTAIAALEAYLRDNAIDDTVSVSVEQFPSDGRQWLGTITVGSNQYKIYMPSLKYENSVSDGIKIGTITLGEQSFDVYAPASSTGGSTVSVVPKTLTGTNIAEITVDGTTYQLYAPTSGGGSGSTVTAEATLTEGTQIGKITIDGVETILYAPNGGGSVTVDSALSAISENPVQNKVVTAEFNKKIETLDDESQAPDAVNFDLDSELSLTSVKGVQNKVIAEEFQKYANGTKTVKKATESETAQSATTAESATKATQDAQGNIIETTYAKKTEIPQGAVVDDALSSTSENPVQNKVVKAEFNRVDSNLTDLKYGEVAGGKNLFTLKGKEIHTDNVKYEVINENSVSITSNDNCPSNQWVQIVVKNIKVKKNTDYVLSISNVSNALSDAMCAVVRTDTSVTVGSKYNVQSNASIKFHVSDYDNVFLILRHSQNDSSGASNHTIIWSNIQLEEGTQATDYEPYIPSVKMIAEKNAQQNDSLSVLGKCKNLLNPTLQTTTKNGVTCTNNGDGTYTLNGTATADIFLSPINEKFEYKYAGQYKIVGCPSNTRMLFYDNASNKYDTGEGAIYSKNAGDKAYILLKIPNNEVLSNVVFKPMITTNLDATYDDFVPYTGDGDTLTADVAKINSDVSNLKDGTTPVAKAVADEDGNNIKETYAKKTEAPSGSIVDSELSETSTNPVQNKVVTAELNNIKEELGVNTSKDNLWLDAYTKDKYTYDYPQPSDLGVFANSSYYPNTQISSEELRHYIGLGKYRLSFYAKVYSELETTVNSTLDITCTYKDNSKLEKTITITNNEQYFEIDFDFDKSVTEIRLYVKVGQCLIKNVTLLCMNNVEEKIDKLRKALCDLGK